MARQQQSFNPATIGGRLARARQDAGYKSQPQFHKALVDAGYKVSRTSVTRWEDDRHLPQPDVGQVSACSHPPASDLVPVERHSSSSGSRSENVSVNDSGDSSAATR